MAYNDDKPIMRTNNHKRQIYYFNELTDKQQKQVMRDYGDLVSYETIDHAQYIVYKDNIYPTFEIERNNQFKKECKDYKSFNYYHGIVNDSYFSGILFRFEFDDDNYEDYVIVCSYCV